jgi:hypothetical protein
VNDDSECTAEMPDMSNRVTAVTAHDSQVLFWFSGEHGYEHLHLDARLAYDVGLELGIAAVDVLEDHLVVLRATWAVNEAAAQMEHERQRGKARRRGLKP